MSHVIFQRGMVSVLVAGVLTLAGCSGGPSDTPPLAKTIGRVTIDGEPLTQGSVQFTPYAAKGTAGRMALGAIQEDGTFEMMTIFPGDGAQVGFHRVAIECSESQPFDPANPTMNDAKSLIPIRYSDPEMSGIEVEVKADEPNEFTFELTR